jgi:hypothetical protein
MLPLDSPRWSELDTFFGEPEKVPHVLGEWIDSIGFDQESTIYSRDLFNIFLHQGTITNVAFAVVPWIVENCNRSELTCRVDYLADVALVELNRLSYGVYSIRDGGDAEPEWLMEAYKSAIERAQSMAEDVLEETFDDELKINLWELMPALFGNIELAKKRMAGYSKNSQK